MFVTIPGQSIFSIPANFTAVNGIRYSFDDWAGEGIPFEKVSGTKPANVKVEPNGSLLAKKVIKKKKSAVITVNVFGEKYKTKVNVIANKYTNKRPFGKDEQAIYSSTNKLYYKNKKLYANVFLLNLTGVGIKGSDDIGLLIYDGDKMIAELGIPKRWVRKTELKNNKYTTMLFTITQNDLPGVAKKQFDLVNGNIRAVLKGDTDDDFPIIPILSKDEGKAFVDKAVESVDEFEDAGEEIIEETQEEELELDPIDDEEML